MILIFIFFLLGEVYLFYVFSDWVALDKTDVPDKRPGSRPQYICSWALPFDHFRTFRPMQSLVVLDSDVLTRTQNYLFWGGPWSLVLLGLLHPPPSAKVLHKLTVGDSIVGLAGARDVRSLESSKSPLGGRQSVISRAIFVFCQCVLEDFHMTI